MNFEAPPDASDGTNAEYETDPEHIATAPAGTADIKPMSVYGIIPADDSRTVIPIVPRGRWIRDSCLHTVSMIARY